MILNDRHRRAFFFGRQSGIRSTGETVEQLQEQLRRERNQRAFDFACLEQEIAILSRQLAEARYEIAKRDREATFAAALSPSTMMH
jgi:hypothetical protein